MKAKELSEELMKNPNFDVEFSHSIWGTIDKLTGVKVLYIDECNKKIILAGVYRS